MKKCRTSLSVNPARGRGLRRFCDWGTSQSIAIRTKFHYRYIQVDKERRSLTPKPFTSVFWVLYVLKNGVVLAGYLLSGHVTVQERCTGLHAPEELIFQWSCTWLASWNGELLFSKQNFNHVRKTAFCLDWDQEHSDLIFGYLLLFITPSGLVPADLWRAVCEACIFQKREHSRAFQKWSLQCQKNNIC